MLIIIIKGQELQILKHKINLFFISLNYLKYLLYYIAIKTRIYINI